MTDDEWALIAPLTPAAKRGGRKRSVDVREVINGLLYVLSTGCQWRYPGLFTRACQYRLNPPQMCRLKIPHFVAV